MATIIAGRLPEQGDAQQAATALLRAGFDSSAIATFYLSSAGQHDRHPLGGDRDASPGAEDTATGRTAGMTGAGAVGAVLGAATAPVTGPLGAVTGAAVGAYVGGLAGSLSDMEEDGQQPDENPVPVRRAGMMLAVAVADGDESDAALDILRQLGAVDIEQAEGSIRDGDWQDFDPLVPPQLVDTSAPPA